MDKIFLDLTNVEKKSEIKEIVAEEFYKALFDFLSERFTMAKQVGNTDIAVVVGQAKDDDGFVHDLCVVAHGTSKPWYDSSRKSGSSSIEIPAYDIEEMAWEYANDPATVKRKERLRKRAEAKAKQIERENRNKEFLAEQIAKIK
jgi:hypothetical protein